MDLHTSQWFIIEVMELWSFLPLLQESNSTQQKRYFIPPSVGENKKKPQSQNSISN